MAPVVLTPIHDIQGPGSSSPILGSTVSTSGIVTGLRTNGFFVQEPDASVDADPATSEGIFVFTSSAPPAAAALGNRVQVTGTVAEFIPSADPFSPPLTEIAGSPAVSILSMGNPLPAAIPLTATFPDPTGPFDQLERLEGMRVSVSSFTVVGPTDGNVSEPNATSTSNGVFFGTVTGVARPFREPGIQAPDPPPSGTIPPIPRFDTNPERLRVDSDAQPGSLRVDVATGQLITGMIGPLDYSFRAYSILPDPASPLIVTGSLSATPVPIPAPNQFTVASFNLERFFDTVNDPGIGDPVLTAAAFANRLNKASLAIRNVLRAPDILGVVEMENLTTLQALAAKISSDAIDAGSDDPNYQAFLVEGNDVGGIDVGFLVKSPRVNVVSVTQEGKDFTWTDPDDNQPALLNDRPPLVLEATIDGFAITVIVNHLRSFLGIESNAPDGLTTEGDRVRQKRKAQAEFLANLVQMRQSADPNERIVLVGDFNAFQFNDGYVDVMGGIKGTPVPAGEAVLTIADLVNPNLINLVDAVTPAERYSYVFEGNAQVLDHILVTSNVIAQLFYARNDADFPETFRNDANRPERISDHDIPVAYFDIACEVTCPANITVPSEPSQCGATVKFSTTETGCGNVVCTPPSGSFFRAGTTTITCAEETSPGPTGVDPGSSCSFTVTVTDTEAPTIACPSNISVATESGQCSAVVNFTVNGSDDCAGVTVVSSPPSGSTFPKGTTTVMSTATDASGNTSSCSFTVTVNDNQPPAISCPASITAIAAGSCAIVNYATPNATDNCPSVSVSCTPPSGACLSPGTTTVTCVATDAAGNTATCSFAVTTFDFCVQDDASASKVALVNSLTGDYRFCCAGTMYTGRGTVSVRGNSLTLEHNGPGRRVLIKVDKGLKSGTASIQVPPGSVACTIRDTNTANNQCACQ
jgi:predicted extracellular nuclease